MMENSRQNNKLNDSYVSQVEELGQAVLRRSIAARTFLDNIDQGLLTFSADLVIHPDYSFECHKIFGKSIEGDFFPGLLFPDNDQEMNFMIQTLKEIFNCKDSFRTKVYISLLPTELELQNRVMSLEYKLVDNLYNPADQSIMVIITEITDKKQLEHKVKEDEGLIRMVAYVAANSDSFMECVRDYQYFYGSKLHELLQSHQSVTEKRMNIYREIHTFKGSFAQFEMSRSVKYLSSMETALSEIRSGLDKLDHSKFSDFIYSFDLHDFIDEDLDILAEKLGNHFFESGGVITIDRSMLGEIEKQIMDICSPVECKTLLPMVRSLKYKSLKELLSSYTSYTVKLADKLDKVVNEFSIKGDDLLVDGEHYGGFIKALGHVFRNSVDHGLESCEERLELGKPLNGTISCNLRKMNDILEIIIADDGRGVDYESIRKRAIELGLFDLHTATQLDEEQLISLLFMESFTTKRENSEISGRGMGLFAVKKELEGLGGKLELHTDYQKGTSLRFLIPLIDIEPLQQIDSASFMQPLLATTMDFLQEQLHNRLKILRIVPFEAEVILLKNYTSLIYIKGMYEGLFAISMENQLIKEMLRLVMPEYEQGELPEQYAKDMLAESANMILGNSIKAFLDIEEFIMIGTPNNLFSKQGDISYTGNQVAGYEIYTDKGTLEIAIIR